MTNTNPSTKTFPLNTPATVVRSKNGTFLVDFQTGMKTAADWKCPSCKADLHHIDRDGACVCRFAHVSF